MAYLYRHIRLDKNEVFYIGIGSDDKGKYKRANDKAGRSQYWKRIAKEGYEIEIILDDLTWEQALEKEKEFIELYGRKVCGTGTLVNFTEGGKGVMGYKHKPEDYAKFIEPNLGKKRSEEAKNNIRNSLIGRKLSEDHKNNLKLIRLGATHSEETKQKMSKSRKGKAKSENHRLKIGLSQLGIKHDIVVCPFCEVAGGNRNMKRYHFDNCKQKKL